MLEDAQLPPLIPGAAWQLGLRDRRRLRGNMRQLRQLRHAQEVRETHRFLSFSCRVFPLLVDLSKPGAGTAPIALPQDQGVALEDPQPASRVQDSATNEICSWQLDANGSFFGAFWSSIQRRMPDILSDTESHYYSTISTQGVCLSYPQALRLVSWLDTRIWLNTSKIKINSL